MHAFQYSSDWADFVVAQLANRHQTRRAEQWGYACLVVGRKFEEVIGRNWHEVHTFTGPYLHIFALVPPPYKFIEERRQQLLRSPDSHDAHLSADRNLALEKFDSILSRRPNWKSLNEQKVDLRQDLREAGLPDNEHADFLFMGFRNEGDNVLIDFVAAKSAAIEESAADREYLACISRMARIAGKNYFRNSPIDKVVKEMSFPWDLKFAVKKGTEAFSFIHTFVSKLLKRD